MYFYSFCLIHLTKYIYIYLIKMINYCVQSTLPDNSRGSSQSTGALSYTDIFAHVLVICNCIFWGGCPSVKIVRETL